MEKDIDLGIIKQLGKEPGSEAKYGSTSNHVPIPVKWP
jgi:hypothetical protein